RIGVAIQGRGQVLGERGWRKRAPRCPGWIGVLAGFYLAAILRRALIGKARAREEYPLGAALAGEVGQVVTRPRTRAVKGAATHSAATLHVVVTREQVEHLHREGSIKAIARHHAAVAIDHRAPPMAGIAACQLDESGLGDAT